MSKEKVNVVIIDDLYYGVPVFVTDWITSSPQESGIYEEEIPDEVLEYLGIDEEDEDSIINVTPSYYENDRALILNSYGTMFESMDELKDYFSEDKYEIGNEFHYEEY